MAKANFPDALRDSKSALRSKRRAASLEEKILEVQRLQQLHSQITRYRRPLRPLERPWDILNEVREAVVIAGDQIEQVQRNIVTSSQSWIRPLQPWVFGSDAASDAPVTAPDGSGREKV